MAECVRERCDYCGAILARDNTEELCSPCMHRREQIKFERELYAWRQRRNYNSEMVRELLRIDVPLPGETDSMFDPGTLIEIVFTYGKTGGNANQTAMRTGINSKAIAAALRRAAARGMIQAMIEEGTWPNNIKLPGDDRPPVSP